MLIGYGRMGTCICNFVIKDEMVVLRGKKKGYIYIWFLVHRPITISTALNPFFPKLWSRVNCLKNKILPGCSCRGFGSTVCTKELLAVHAGASPLLFALRNCWM